MRAKTRLLSLISTVITLGVCLLAFPCPAWADVAPPEPPPGSNLQPGSETTQVQMVSETVTLEVKAKSNIPAEPYLVGEVCFANVTAHFTMRNQGTTEEQMTVRFPLRNPNGMSDVQLNFPEIKDINVKIDGKTVKTTKTETPNPAFKENPPVTWANFEVTFPPATDVQIDVAYTQEPSGYMPFATFTYILETGTGWKDAISTADLIVRLPYEADELNVLNIDWPETTPGGQFVNDEIRWHYEDLEPVAEDNLQITIVTPNAWKAVLDAKKSTVANPKDGNAWGTLARAYKYALLMAKGYPRRDAGGAEIDKLSEEAYIQATSLVPRVAKWHAGYGELLWVRFEFADYPAQKDYTLLQKAVGELQAALKLEPKNQQALDLVTWLSYQEPESVKEEGDTYTYPILTTLPPTPIGPPPDWTPEIPTEAPQETTATVALQPAALPQSTATTAPTATPKKAGGLFTCGGAALMVVLLAGGFAGFRRLFGFS